MVAEETAAGLEIRWCDDALGLRVVVDDQGVARLAHLAPRPRDQIEAGLGKAVPSSGEPGAIGLPLLDVVVAGSGRSWSGRRYCESVVGNRMRYAGHTEREGAQWFELEVSLEDTFTGLRASVTYEVLLGAGALRSRGQDDERRSSAVDPRVGDLLPRRRPRGPWRLRSTTPSCFGRKTIGWPRHAGSPGASATHYRISTGPCTVPAPGAGSL